MLLASVQLDANLDANQRQPGEEDCAPRYLV
jgi:hypothetical protein